MPRDYLRTEILVLKGENHDRCFRGNVETNI